jgi:hypothetical protein
LYLDLVLKGVGPDHRVEMTKPGQGSASSFCSKEPRGFGFLPTYARFYPAYMSVTLKLVPCLTEVNKAPRLRIFGEKMGLQTWGETESGGVNTQFSNVHSLYEGLRNNGQKTVSFRKLILGIASQASHEDCHHSFGGLYLSAIEHKGAGASPLGALAQGAVVATNFAMELLRRGLPRSECIIPVIGHTGILAIFGAVVVLEPSFPTFIPLSKHLNLSDPEESQIASAFLMKATEHCHDMCMKLRDRSSIDSFLPLALSLTQYHVKTMTHEVYARGLGLFSQDAANKDDINAGVAHMFEALNRLYVSEEARQFVEFPLSIRTPDENSFECYQIIYNDLTKEGFQIGAPDRSDDEDVFQAYRKQLIYAVECIHNAGVIHVDLYLSNVMWRKQDGGDGVDIKIIDWDVAHCLNESEFVPSVQSRLEDYLGARNVHFGISHDLLYLSPLSLDKDEYIDQWVELASGDKARIDEAFRYLLNITFGYIGHTNELTITGGEMTGYIPARLT